MTIRLRPPKSQLNQLRAIAEIGAVKLHEISVLLDRPSGQLHLHPSELVERAAAICSSNQAEALVGQLVALYGLVRKAGVSPQEIGDSIQEAIDNSSEDDGVAWQNISESFVSLLSSRTIRIVATLVDLTYDYANLVRSMRIITDVRPLFDEGATEIEAAVVSYTLRLDYDSADGNHELSLALDKKDLKSLMQQCERALKKAETAKSKLLDNVNIPGVISGSFEGDER